MINAETAAAVERIAAVRGFEAAALKAFIETESAGTVYATVDGKKEPLVRFEGHYFYRLCSPLVRSKAVGKGLASPSAGAVANPSSQQARWDRLLKPAMELDLQAAYESCSWGVGQIMGAHWKMLGFNSVVEMVDLARSGVEGQIELMARFIEKSGLKGALARHDWAAVARGYNGPNYKVNKYDEKMADAYARYNGAGRPQEARDGAVLHIQQRLVAHGFDVSMDGMRGPQTEAAIRAFQKKKGLLVDGVVGRFTMEALNDDPPAAPAAPVMPSPIDAEPAPPAKPNLLTTLISILAKLFAGRAA